MTAGQKTAVSLLSSMVVFGACLAFALMGGFDLIEIKYYEPRVVQNVSNRLDDVSRNFDEYIDGLQTSFAEYAENKCVATYIERDVSEEDSAARNALSGKLFDSIPGLDGMRIIEADGVKMHYSTFASDVLTETEEQISYRPYNTLNDIPFFLISTADNGEYAGTADALKNRCSLYFDSSKEQIVFSLPYFDHFTAYRGTIVFYINGNDFMRSLIASNVVSLNTRCTIVAPENTDANYENHGNMGFVFNVPFTGRELVKKEIEGKWTKGLYGVEQLVRNDDTDRTLVLITGQKSKYVEMGWICDESEFAFSTAERALILICVFITVFLIIFLAFNIHHDDMTVIEGRVHKFQMALITEYIQRKDNADWNQIAKELNYRKVDVNDEIKKSLGRKGKKHSKELDELLDESWNELFAAVGGMQPSSKAAVSSSSLSSAKLEEKKNELSAEPVEDLEEITDAEPVEDLEEITDAEPVEDLEEITDAEPVEDLEEIPDAEPVEDLEEVEEVEDLEKAEAADNSEKSETVEVPVAAVVPSFHGSSQAVTSSAPALVTGITSSASQKTPAAQKTSAASGRASLLHTASSLLKSASTASTSSSANTVSSSAVQSSAKGSIGKLYDELEEIGEFEKKSVIQDMSYAEKFNIAPMDFTSLDTLSEEELKKQKDKKPEQIDL